MMHRSRFELTARGVIIKNGRILLFRLKGAPWYYYPGGHVEFRERAENALRREIREELGLPVRNIKYMGTLENIFFMMGSWHHALEIAFSATLIGTPNRTLEPHEECEWIPLNRYKTIDVRPRALRTEVLRWLRTRKTFWATEYTKRR